MIVAQRCTFMKIGTILLKFVSRARKAEQPNGASVLVPIAERPLIFTQIGKIQQYYVRVANKNVLINGMRNTAGSAAPTLKSIGIGTSLQSIA